LAGLIAGYVLITIFEIVGTLVYPLPAGVDPMNMEALREIVDQIPAGAFVFIIVGWGVGTFAGSWVAGRIATRNKSARGLVVTVLLTLGGLFTLLAIPHPVWVWVLGLAALVGGGYAGSRLAARAIPAG
jgi:predicted MFS family arabinose efflux permease